MLSNCNRVIKTGSTHRNKRVFEYLYILREVILRLTIHASYAIEVLSFLAVHTGKRWTTAEVAAALGGSKNHITKVVHGLAVAGYITTGRGRAGGIMLARPAIDISLGDIVRLVENFSSVVDCYRDGKAVCKVAGACAMQGMIEEAVEAFFKILDRYSIADVADDELFPDGSGLFI